MYYFVGRAGQGRAVVLRGGELDATTSRACVAVARMRRRAVSDVRASAVPAARKAQQRSIDGKSIVA